MSATRRKPDDAVSLRTFVLGGGALLVAATLLWLAFTAPQGLPVKSYYTIRAEFRNLANLPERGADVRIAGDRVGQALDARLEHGRATIDLQLERGSGPLRADTTARVRPRGLLGMQYVDLVPGTRGRPLPDGGLLHMRQSSASVQLPEVLSAFDGRHRRALQQALRGLGDGFAGRGRALNDELRDGAGVLRDFRRLSEGVLARAGAPQRFVRSAEALASASEPVREDIARGFAPEARALRPFRVERPSVQRALERAPAALDALRGGLRRADPMLRQARAFAAATERFTAAAPAALAATRRLLVESRRPLLAARPALADTRRTVPAILRVTRAADPVLPRLRQTLEAAVPLSAELGRHGCDMRGFWANWSDMLANGEGGGGEIGPLNAVRFEMFGNLESVAGAGARRPETGRNPYPAPCAAGSEKLP